MVAPRRPLETTAAERAIADLDHSAWHGEMEAAIRKEWRDPEAAGAVRAVWEKTRSERALGFTSGPFTRSQLEGVYGEQFRAMRRFGILQHGKLRACDNARTSLHNEATTRLERMVNETADFPARAAAAFHEALGYATPMRGGGSDVAAFYRQVPTDAHHYTVVAPTGVQGVDRRVRLALLHGLGGGSAGERVGWRIRPCGWGGQPAPASNRERGK